MGYEYCMIDMIKSRAKSTVYGLSGSLASSDSNRRYWRPHSYIISTLELAVFA